MRDRKNQGAEKSALTHTDRHGIYDCASAILRECSNVVLYQLRLAPFNADISVGDPMLCLAIKDELTRRGLWAKNPEKRADLLTEHELLAIIYGVYTTVTRHNIDKYDPEKPLMDALHRKQAVRNIDEP